MNPPDGDQCARCHRVNPHHGVRWPEGNVCRRCYQQAARRSGACPGCDTTRLLPGLTNGGEAICADCAGIDKDFYCQRCGEEDEPYRAGICARCSLRDDLAALLDDGAGHVSAPLVGVFEAICKQEHARSAIIWLRNPDVRELLQGFASGALPISRETFSAHPSRRTATHLRELFIQHGALDAWLAPGPTTRYQARNFIRWAAKTRRLPPLDIPHRQARSTQVLGQQERLTLLDKCFRATTIAPRNRVAAILLLLYAQPVSRISRLRLDDIVDNGTTMTIAFGRHPASVPDPIAAIIRGYVSHRSNMATAANATSPWLFPGYRPGQPLTHDYLMQQLRGAGLPLRSAKNSALRHLVLAMPPAIAAQTLGYSTTVAEQHAKQSGAIWSAYPTAHQARTPP